MTLQYQILGWVSIHDDLLFCTRWPFGPGIKRSSFTQQYIIYRKTQHIGIYSVTQQEPIISPGASSFLYSIAKA